MTKTVGPLLLTILGLGLFLPEPGWYSIGPVYNAPPGVSLVASLGLVCLLAEVVMVTASWRDATEPGSSDGRVVAVTGAALAFASLYLAFPVGCNVASSCPGDPVGTWSTVWPNVASLVAGMSLFAWGFGRWKSRAAAMPALGMGLVFSGLITLMFGLLLGYTVFCPAGGCRPLTFGEWWSVFWPDVVADAVGVSFVVSGLGIEIRFGW